MLSRLFSGALALALFCAPASAQTYRDASGTTISGVVPLVGCTPGGVCSGAASASTPLPVSVSGPFGSSTNPANAVAGVSPDGAAGNGAATGVVDNVFGSTVSTVGYNSVQFSVTGTFVATASVSGSFDGGAHWSNALWTQTQDTGFCTSTGLSGVGTYLLFNPPPLLKVSVTAYTSGAYTVGYALRSNTAASPYICNNASNLITVAQGSSASGAYGVLHAASASLSSSLVVKTGVGNLYNGGCSAVSGGAAGHCIAIAATSAPSSGSAIAPVDVCDFSASQTSCAFSHNSFGVNYSPGITILISSNASPFVFTSGTAAGFAWGDYK